MILKSNNYTIGKKKNGQLRDLETSEAQDDSHPWGNYPSPWEN